MILYTSRYLENVFTTVRGFTVSFNDFVRYFSSHNELLLIYGAYYGQPMAPAFRQSSTDIFANVSILFVNSVVVSFYGPWLPERKVFIHSFTHSLIKFFLSF